MAESHGWGTPNGASQTPTVTPLPSRRVLRDARTDAMDPRSVRRPEHAVRRTAAPVRPTASTASVPVAPRGRTRSRVVVSGGGK